MITSILPVFGKNVKLHFAQKYIVFCDFIRYNRRIDVPDKMKFRGRFESRSIGVLRLDNQSKKTVAICNMGCKVNSYEAEGMTELLEKAGYQIVGFHERADVYVINTCTVTQIAARKSRQMIHRARKMNEQALIIAAGCYVDRDHSLIEEGVIDLAIPNRQKGHIVSYIEAYQKGDEYRPEQEEAKLWISRFEGRSRAFLKVQDGCRQFCTYCIIPYVRGPLTSRPIEECCAEAEGLAAKGYSEIVLTGIHLSSYGKKEGYQLADLIVAIAQIPQVKRIRLGSLEPGVITADFLRQVQPIDKLCPHFHLSLQSGADTTLKAMGRRYSAQEYRQAVQLLREAYPQAAVTTDVIVGFPGETQQDHEASLRFVQEIGFAQVHVFRYSQMEGTVAAKCSDQVDAVIKKKRSEEMLAVTEQSTRAFMQAMQGTRAEVLLEEQDPVSGYWLGYTPNYMKVAIEGCGPETGVGRLVDVTIDGWVTLEDGKQGASSKQMILKGVDEHE